MRDHFLLFVLMLMMPLHAGAQNFNSSDAIETVGQGTINWTIGEVYATGIGAPPANAVNPGQARAMAERAAMVVALRNLLETVKGVRVDSETVVEDFVTKTDIIRTRVDGIVRGAMPVKKQYLSDGSVEITVSMRMKGAFLNVIVPETFGSFTHVAPPLPPPPVTGRPSPARPTPAPERPAETPRPEPIRPPAPPAEPVQPAPPSHSTEPSTAQFKGGKATGVVIDGRGLGLRPALLPRIVDPQGQEIYVGQVVTRTNAVEQGVAGYAKDVNAAANNFRVTDNPAVLKGLRASGSARTDIVLSGPDAQVLRELSKKGDFLQFCRVIIVY